LGARALSEIESWLESIGASEYASRFVAEKIDLPTLQHLTEDDLKELGLPMGPRRKVLAAIAALVGSTGRIEPTSSVQLADHTPQHLAEMIRTSRGALEGERKLVTVMFADIKGSLELMAGLDAEVTRHVLDPTIKAMMRGVHRYEGTVSKLLGDGIMAVFGAPIAHEDHAVRACYAALAIHDAMREVGAELRRQIGVEPMIRIGINSGEVIVRSIGNDLTVEYDAIGPTVHLASRLEQLARPGTTRVSLATARLGEGWLAFEALGEVPIKGLAEPIQVFELTGALQARTRLQASGPTTFTKFVGREPEIARIAEALAATRQGNGQIVAVVGEAGIGKSRLYHEVLHSSVTADCLILESGSVSHGKATSYLPVADLLRSYFGVEPSDDARQIHERCVGRLLTLDERLGTTINPLLSVLDLPVTDEAWLHADPARRRGLTVDAFKALIHREAQERAVVLVFEDLHWADNETLSLLDGLVESLPAARILLLVNYRPEFSERWASKSYFTRLRLQALPPQSAQALLDDLLGGSAELETVKQMLATRTAGNPFFLEESVRSLIELGLLVGERGARRVSGNLGDVAVPPTVQAVLAARIDRLEPDVKRALQTAAVIGKDFSHSLLAEVSDLSADRLDACMATLRASEFVYETRLFPEAEYTFKHALTHDVALGGLLTDRRRELDVRIVDAIERVHGERLAEHLDALAMHATRGGVWPKAYHYSVEAGNRAAAHSAHRDSVAHYLRALEALGRHEASDAIRAEIDLRLKIRDELFVLGDHGPVPAHVQAAADLARKIDDPRRLARALLDLGAVEWVAARHLRSREIYSEALSTAEAAGDPVLVALVNYRLGIANVMLGDMKGANETLVKSLKTLDTEEGRRLFAFGGSPFSFACTFRAWALAELGHLAEAEAVAKSGFDNARALDQPYTILVSTYGYSHALIRRGQWERAAEILDVGREQLRLHDVMVGGTWVLARRALVAANMGDAALTDLMIEQTIAAVAKSLHDSLHETLLADAELRLGRFEGAANRARQAVTTGAEKDESASVAWGSLILAEALTGLGKGDEAEARAALQRARELTERHGLVPLAERVNILHNLGTK
jgi:class 3 adenylate cyclase/tetratricopeptide (TPR) repeat protein